MSNTSTILDSWFSSIYGELIDRDFKIDEVPGICYKKNDRHVNEFDDLIFFSQPKVNDYLSESRNFIKMGKSTSGKCFF